MTSALALKAVRRQRLRHSYQITGTAYRFVVATPDAEPEVWSEFLVGARRAYALHGIEEAVDPAFDASNTAAFFAAVDSFGTVVGGVRAQGPYVRADQAHALGEWAGHAGENELRKMIVDRLPFGVVEVKTAWVRDGLKDSRAVSHAIARTALPLTSLLGTQFLLATASDYILGRWESSGGRVAANIAPAPYPTPESAAKVMWWDRRKILSLAHPELVPIMLREAAELRTGGDPQTRDFGLKVVGSELIFAAGG